MLLLDPPACYDRTAESRLKDIAKVSFGFMINSHVWGCVAASRSLLLDSLNLGQSRIRLITLAVSHIVQLLRL